MCFLSHHIKHIKILIFDNSIDKHHITAKIKVQVKLRKRQNDTNMSIPSQFLLSTESRAMNGALKLQTIWNQKVCIQCLSNNKLSPDTQFYLFCLFFKKTHADSSKFHCLGAIAISCLNH